VHLRSGHGRAVNYAFFAYCPARITQTITPAGSRGFLRGRCHGLSQIKAALQPDHRELLKKGILNRSLSGQEDGPLPYWQVVCPPPRHPRAARYPRGLRGEQATVYLAQRSLPPCLSEPFAGVMRRIRGLREIDSWFEGSRAPGLTPRTDSTFFSRAVSPAQPHRNPLQIAFKPIYRRFSWFEGNRLVV
jgi:hypothetical protein